MTDWGDATLNEKARRRTMPLPPDEPAAFSPAAAEKARKLAEQATAEEQVIPAVPRQPTDPVDHHDAGKRQIPPPERGES